MTAIGDIPVKKTAESAITERKGKIQLPLDPGSLTVYLFTHEFCLADRDTNS